MSIALSRDSRRLHRLWALLRRAEVYHALAWVGFAVVLWLVEGAPADPRAIIAVVASIGFYAAMVYFNLSYLFPSYLDEKRPVAYLALFVLAAALLTPLRSVVIYWTAERNPAALASLLAQQTLIFVSHLAVGALSTMLKIAADWTRNSRERQRLQAQNLQSELRFLRTQINPHFLFNTLNSLYALTLKKSDRAPETVLKLSAMMRYMLYESNARAVPLAKEVEYLHNYLDLERLRYGESADIVFEVHGDTDGREIAPMILVTFVENAFKHGLGRVLSGGFVHMVLVIEGAEIRFHIENAKPSTPEQALGPGGIGLANVSRRLELLYPEQHELQTLVTDQVYAVDLYLDLTHALSTASTQPA